MSFDTLAPYYRAMELVLAGRTLQRSRMAHLGAVRNCRRALLLGEGPGRFLTELLGANPSVQVVCVEQSPRMISVAQCQLRRHDLDSGRVEFIQANALQWRPGPGDFDLVVTNFFLDCFQGSEIQSLIGKVAARTTPAALWLVTDFRIPAKGWRKWRARIVVSLMYHFFRWVAGLSASGLTAADAYLQAAGFQLRNRQTLNFELVHTDLWARTAV